MTYPIDDVGHVLTVFMHFVDIGVHALKNFIVNNHKQFYVI